jgi:hypothetical protein
MRNDVRSQSRPNCHYATRQMGRGTLGEEEEGTEEALRRYRIACENCRGSKLKGSSGMGTLY